jgi:hypothetical protein
VDRVYFPGPDTKLPAVLVTPACDLEQEKVSLWTFVALFPDTTVAKSIVDRESGSFSVDKNGLVLSPSARQRGHLERKLEELMKQRYYRYHWLPLQLEDHDGHVADFSFVTSVPADEVRTKAVRVASMNSSWREELPAHFAAYIGRVGVEDYPPQTSTTHLQRLVGSVIAHPK